MTATPDVGTLLREEVAKLDKNFCVCGVVDHHGVVYPLGSDTKVLSTIFELVSRPAVFRAAERMGLTVHEPESQNVYPDFTLMRGPDDKAKIAVDVKTTYRDSAAGRFSYTLGGYTSFIRPGQETKNIAFHHNDYVAHWVIGFDLPGFFGPRLT